ncbi:hypothetical protein JOD25_001867 [Kurthia huakuii]|nr:hypothetical protein [Kurthia huakuii]
MQLQKWSKLVAASFVGISLTFSATLAFEHT